MKLQAPAGVVERAGAAEVMKAVVFQEAADFGGAIRRGLGGGEPAVDFGGAVVHGDGVDFEVGVAK
jgi:hypothetical protein